MALYITATIPCQTVHCNYSTLLDFTLPYNYNKIQNGTPLCLTKTLLYKTKPHIATTRLYYTPPHNYITVHYDTLLNFATPVRNITERHPTLQLLHYALLHYTATILSHNQTIRCCTIQLHYQYETELDDTLLHNYNTVQDVTLAVLYCTLLHYTITTLYTTAQYCT